MILKKINVDGKTLYEEVNSDELDSLNEEEVVLATNAKENKSTEAVNPDITKLIPFMDEEDVDKVINKIIDKVPGYENLGLASFIPFSDKADDIFMKLINKNDLTYNSIIPFVSDECLTKLVDLYVSGQLNNINFDNIYPFLSSKDIYRLFNYYIENVRK